MFWHDLTSINNISSWNCASVKGGANNKTLFLFSGWTDSDSLVNTFDTQINSWSIPKIIGGDNVIRKDALTGIVDHSGKMYLFSGYHHAYDNDMLILDTINLKWEKGSSVNVPHPRVFYSATLLPNQHIIYLGKYLIIHVINITDC